MKTQEQAIGFTPGTLFSKGYVAGNTLYVAGQQGLDSNGNVTVRISHYKLRTPSPR